MTIFVLTSLIFFIFYIRYQWHIVHVASPNLVVERENFSNIESNNNKSGATIPKLLIPPSGFQETPMEKVEDKEKEKLDDSEWLKSFIQSSKSSSNTLNISGKQEAANQAPPPPVGGKSRQNSITSSPTNSDSAKLPYPISTGPKFYKTEGRGSTPVDDVSQSSIPRPYGVSVPAGVQNNSSSRPILPRRPSFTDGSVGGGSLVSRLSATEIFADDEKSETQSLVSLESYDKQSRRPPISPGKSLIPKNKSNAPSLVECFSGSRSGDSVNSKSSNHSRSKSSLKSNQQPQTHESLKSKSSSGSLRMHKVDRFCGAALQGDLGTIQILFERYPDLIHKVNSGRCSVDNIDRIGPPICWAAYGGDVEVTRFLLYLGAKIEDLDEFEWSPIMLAANLGHVGVVQMLLRKGADVERTSKKGLNAQKLALKKGHSRIVEMIARHKVVKQSTCVCDYYD